LADEAFAKAFLKEKFEKQTRAFERVLKGVLSQAPFQRFSSQILEIWNSNLQSYLQSITKPDEHSVQLITKYDDDSASDCCEAFLHKLLMNGEQKGQKELDAARKKLARILRCFRQDFYVGVTTSIRNFFSQETDYERVVDADTYTYFHSIKADESVEIDSTCKIICQTPSLSFTVAIHNHLRSSLTKLESTWDSCMDFTIESVVPLDPSLVKKSGTIPELLETTILKPLLLLGYPAEARLASIQVERLVDS